MTSPVRIGAVAYLNSKPLIHRLTEVVPDARLVLDVPSRLADSLDAGGLDVALVPVIEFLRHGGYEIVSDACIACEGPVHSVKLFSRVPVGQIRTLALDEGSRTSIALTKILLAERCGVYPEERLLPLGAGLGDVEADALLLIGDRAIHPPRGRWAVVWDLGEEWTSWTGLPFVFALWAGRRGMNAGDLGTRLGAVRDAGLADVAAIAAAEGPPVGFTIYDCRRYLTVNLHYRLGVRERQGMELFRRKAEALGMLAGRGAVVEGVKST